jgi:hypothetical protein
MRRFDYVMKKFGITKKQLGVILHGLRHEGLINDYEKLTCEAPPVRSGALLSRWHSEASAQAVWRVDH